MKKILALLFIAFFLVSCFNKEETKKETSTGTWVSVENVVEDKKIVTYSWINVDISEKNLSKERSEIKLDDIEWINFSNEEKEKNNLLALWKEFIKNIEKTKKFDLTEHEKGWVSFEDLENEAEKIPEDLKKDIDLELKIFDFENKKSVKNWTIFVNGVNLWEFKDWKFQKEFLWPKWIENFTIMVRSPGYWDAFLKVNSINTEWSYLFGEIKLKKLDYSEKVKLDKEVKIENKNIIVKIPECSLVKADWECYKWEAEAKINFISADDVNQKRVSLNMKAMTKEGNIVELQSGWMAFTDFVTSDWQILKVWKWKTVEITYKVDEKTISDMENTLYGQGQKNGYWLYDKNKNIWLEKDAKIKLDKKNKTWTAVVSEIY